MESILTSIKKLLGITSECTHFDPDLIMHINSVLFILTQIGVGPEEGFAITGETETWTDFLGEELINFNAVKSYVHLKTRLLFDTSQSSSVNAAVENMIKELECRLYVTADNKREE